MCINKILTFSFLVNSSGKLKHLRRHIFFFSELDHQISGVDCAS